MGTALFVHSQLTTQVSIVLLYFARRLVVTVHSFSKGASTSQSVYNYSLFPHPLVLAVSEVVSLSPLLHELDLSGCLVNIVCTTASAD